MSSLLEKRSVSLAGHATSIALEQEFWSVLEAMGGDKALARTLLRIDSTRGPRPLASACRVAALEWALANGAAQAIVS